MKRTGPPVVTPSVCGYESIGAPPNALLRSVILVFDGYDFHKLRESAHVESRLKQGTMKFV